MTNELPEHIWFIRDSSRGYYPVHPKAWHLVFRFAIMLGVCFVAGLVCAVILDERLGLGLFAVGAAASAWWFIAAVRAHGDFSGRYSLASVGRARG